MASDAYMDYTSLIDVASGNECITYTKKPSQFYFLTMHFNHVCYCLLAIIILQSQKSQRQPQLHTDCMTASWYNVHVFHAARSLVEPSQHCARYFISYVTRHDFSFSFFKGRQTLIHILAIFLVIFAHTYLQWNPGACSTSTSTSTDSMCSAGVLTR